MDGARQTADDISRTGNAAILPREVRKWDRGRPARNAPQARSFAMLCVLNRVFALLSAGGTPAIPVTR